MYNFIITNIHTNEIRHMFGYNRADAYRRAKLNKTDWEIIDYEYVD